MKYMGSKSRIAKFIVPIMLDTRRDGQWFVEPFVGGSNLIDKVPNPRIGNDLNYYLIEFSKHLRDGWLPPKNVSEKLYEIVKANKSKFHPRFVGYCGFQLSYGSKWFDSYRRDNSGNRDYSLEAYNNVRKQAEKLNGIVYFNKQYYDFPIPKNSIIYCDPPYKNTTKYSAVDEFDYNNFYDWCKKMVSLGHTVFISEYDMPSDFECVWEKEITSSLTKNTGEKRGVERLFRTL